MEYISKYEEYLRKGFLEEKPILLDSLIEYYGEEYRELITNRFNSIEFFFYVPKSKRKLKSSMIEKEIKKESFEHLKNELKSIKKEIKKQPSYLEQIKASIIYSTTPKTLIDDDTLKYFDEIVFKKELICMKSMLYDDEYVRCVFIPIFFANDQCLIHETIHAITSDIIGTIDENVIEKWGLVNTGDYYRDSYLEEATTELEAIAINKIFKKKGGNYLSNIYPFQFFFAVYNMLIPLIKDYYDFFKKDIIFSRLTLNKNRILNLCGKEEYFNLATLIDECYSYYPEVKSYDYYSFKDISDSYIKDMKAHKLELKK